MTASGASAALASAPPVGYVARAGVRAGRPLCEVTYEARPRWTRTDLLDARIEGVRRAGHVVAPSCTIVRIALEHDDAMTLTVRAVLDVALELGDVDAQARGGGFPLREIAARACVGVRTARRAVATAIDAGYLVVWERSGRHSLYDVRLPEQRTPRRRDSEPAAAVLYLVPPLATPDEVDPPPTADSRGTPDSVAGVPRPQSPDIGGTGENREQALDDDRPFARAAAPPSSSEYSEHDLARALAEQLAHRRSDLHTPGRWVRVTTARILRERRDELRALIGERLPLTSAVDRLDDADRPQPPGPSVPAPTWHRGAACACDDYDGLVDVDGSLHWCACNSEQPFPGSVPLRGRPPTGLPRFDPDQHHHRNRRLDPR